MKAFERQKADRLNHPEDVFVIVACLEKLGKLNVGVNTLEDLYYDFSKDCACGWRSVTAESISEFADWLEGDKIMTFYDAWTWLSEHPIFHGLFECGLYTVVVKVNPKTNEVDDDLEKNTKVQIWLEHGPYDEEYTHTHDFELDCGGDTFEEAIIELTKLVKEHYGDYEKE